LIGQDFYESAGENVTNDDRSLSSLAKYLLCGCSEMGGSRDTLGVKSI
jgi:hypothetical protein